MRQITEGIEISIDGSRTGFRLSKLDAFSGVMLLRLLLRLENQPRWHPEQAEGSCHGSPNLKQEERAAVAVLH